MVWSFMKACNTEKVTVPKDFLCVIHDLFQVRQNGCLHELTGWFWFPQYPCFYGRIKHFFSRLMYWSILAGVKWNKFEKLDLIESRRRKVYLLLLLSSSALHWQSINIENTAWKRFNISLWKYLTVKGNIQTWKFMAWILLSGNTQAVIGEVQGGYSCTIL